MNKRILAFGASNSANSINKALAKFSISLITPIESTLLDLNDFELPIFGVDREKKDGFPQNVIKFKELIMNHDGILISLAEHNGAYSTAFKNLFDWLSRLEGKAWDNKPMILLGTSPGGRGASSVIEIAAKRFPFNGGKVVETFSLPSFYKNFDSETGIIDATKLAELKTKLDVFVKSL